MADKKPLWEVAQNAFLGVIYAGGDDQDAYEAMLCAIADEVVPETMEPVYTLPWVGSPNWARWDQRMETRALLLQAAPRPTPSASGTPEAEEQISSECIRPN
jgi:hypothetical protein